MLGSFKIVAFCVFTCIVVELNVVISVNIYWQSTPEQMLWEEGSGSTNRACLQKMDNLVGIQVTCIEEKWERVSRAWGFVFGL